MAERSFHHEIQSLRLGAGETFRGEGILAVTKALLQSGVSYVGGYQGAPVSHLMDVLVDAEDLLSELGIHIEACTNEAAAAAMLGASIAYPIRGAVTWKSVVGTNVASDALSNLASPGVIGGAMIIIGEDYGDGASVIQERSHAFAMKSSIWLLDPRPHLPAIVHMVEKGFELSEASHSPVMLDLRIKACHVTGEFETKDNRAAAFSRNAPLGKPAAFDYAKLSHPPSTFAHEIAKVTERMPAAQAFIREHKLNEWFAGDLADIGIVVQGGLYNSLMRALMRLDLADALGNTRIPIYCLNVTYPLVPEEVTAFCASKRAVLMVEEGTPDYIEQALGQILRKADLQTKLFGKDCLPQAGEYTSDVMVEGLAAFVEQAVPQGFDAGPARKIADALKHHRQTAAALLDAELPGRQPGFCTGCPERPVFSALKLAQKDVGPTHVSADIGCHSFGTLPPFSMGNSILGFGMSLASAAAVGPNLGRRPISVMGDGGFWHNGSITGVAGTLFNRGDGILVIMQNGYTSATGQQFMPSTIAEGRRAETPMNIEATLKVMGVKWLKTVRSYSVGTMKGVIKDAMTTTEKGLKVIIADGECQLARQRRVKSEDAAKVKAGERVIRVRYGVDDEVCSGDHSCIRLSGCPSLTIKPNPDPLRDDPVAAVINSCVGCGLCGEVAHAAVLCPSFWRAEVVQNPSRFDLWLDGWRNRLRGWLQAEAVS
ncbi:indolepyruvate ferredoxin oxidoreductase [Paramagnetospirillum kuznetsovii]|uniref:Indolepyruvate ferredoxin oxidoreductase n=1 Tax=Paramagnetospirillum kuznetsovii TaxID=2053833 RepID=A0A364P1F7_9PROT|nr:indolepyruvate ferredoxin oxidoreductase subunit alpha [Paramagnetospirillum kuznetsovii]RAU22997.1 indolepyruvate ferredoxin oxidoreductase [Paramagnetospirillum kuznetsovii]